MLKYTEQRRLALLLYHFRAIVSDDSMAPADDSAEKQCQRFLIWKLELEICDAEMHDQRRLLAQKSASCSSVANARPCCG